VQYPATQHSAYLSVDATDALGPCRNTATVGGAGVDISGDLVASGNVIDAASVGIYDHLEGKKCVQCFR
jgi:hypothetical protein